MNMSLPAAESSSQRPPVSMLLVGVLALCVAPHLAAESGVDLNIDNYDPACGIKISRQNSLLQVAWPTSPARRARLTFDLTPGQPLIHSAATSGSTGSFRSFAEGLHPVILVRTGKRDLDKRGGWTIFFDRMQRKPSELFRAEIERQHATAASQAQRATLTIGEVSAGPFRGQLRWTFYAGSPFVLQEAVLQTNQDGVAYLYDAGLVCRNALPKRMSWRDATGKWRAQPTDSSGQARHFAVRGRAVGAEFEGGSIAVFPPPHRYFYPLDFSDNLKNIWIGEKYQGQPLEFGFGVRHDPRGDNRFVPWINAPPGTVQELSLFLLLSDGTAEETLREAAELTRHDRFAQLSGHTVFSSHYHVEHTRELLGAQEEEAEPGTTTGKLASGEAYRIPERLKTPGFVRVFREMGVDIVHLAEFHFGQTPRMTRRQRVQHLQLLHAECQRLSDERFLLLPGEEPNVHLGGHWISFFPKPVLWVLNRPAGTPFAVEQPNLGRVYHVGGKADVLRLLRAEGGLAWTAHPRIKGSTGFPDRYRDELFFQSDRFLGAAWKAMPADLSQPRLGSRVLDLLNAMSNWGDPKYVLGEVDVFKIEPDHELYAHMNVNYLRLDELPRFEDGWQPVLDALRGGQFFVTTGEVLIPEFTVNGHRSGELATVTKDRPAEVRLDLKWTFPLSYAEIVSGNGQQTSRRRIDLSATESFGEQTLKLDIDATGQNWLRVEVWDVATNGAFTQPVWLQHR